MVNIDNNAPDPSSLERLDTGTRKDNPPHSTNHVHGKLDRLGIEASENNQDGNLNGKEIHRSHTRVPSVDDEGYESDKISKRGKDSTSTISRNSNLPTLTFTSSLFTSPRTEHFAKTYTVFAHTASGTEAGAVCARFIDRSLLQTKRSNKFSSFYTSMQKLNSCNSDGWAFASALFCERAMLLRKVRDVGPWGREIEKGALLIVKYLRVEKGFRRQGLARKLLDGLVGKVRERMEERRKKGKGKGKGEELKFMVVFPAVIKEDLKEEMQGKSEEEMKEIEERAYEKAVKFYTAFGFRRVGHSGWFAFGLMRSIPSLRRGRVEDDLVPPEVEGE